MTVVVTAAAICEVCGARLRFRVERSWRPGTCAEADARAEAVEAALTAGPGPRDRCLGCGRAAEQAVLRARRARHGLASIAVHVAAALMLAFAVADLSPRLALAIPHAAVAWSAAALCAIAFAFHARAVAHDPDGAGHATIRQSVLLALLGVATLALLPAEVARLAGAGAPLAPLYQTLWRAGLWGGVLTFLAAAVALFKSLGRPERARPAKLVSVVLKGAAAPPGTPVVRASSDPAGDRRGADLVYG